MEKYSSAKLKIMIVVGGRHDYMKAAPIVSGMGRYCDFLDTLLIHTGPQFDPNMAETFYKTLRLPRPDIFLNLTGKSFAALTGKVIADMDRLIQEEHPQLLMVIGDSNSALASALAASKSQVAIAHIDSGLRAFDKGMPKEVNRLLIDRITDFHFTSEANSHQNLAAEGVDEGNIFFVGNLMSDLFLNQMHIAQNRFIIRDLDLEPQKYILVTLHQPANLDNKKRLGQILEAIKNISIQIPVVFSCDTNTKTNLIESDYMSYFDRANVKLMDQMMYLDFLKLESEAAIVLTDSAGIQEETTLLNIPCVTLLKSTERQATINEGTNILVGPYPEKIIATVESILKGNKKTASVPKYWDGRVAPRILEILMKIREILLRPGPSKLGTTKMKIVEARAL